MRDSRWPLKWLLVVVQMLCGSNAPEWARRNMNTMTKKRRRHTPEQIIRKLAESNKLLAGGQDLEDV